MYLTSSSAKLSECQDASIYACAASQVYVNRNSKIRKCNCIWWRKYYCTWCFAGYFVICYWPLLLKACNYNWNTTSLGYRHVGEWVVGGRVRRWVGGPVARRYHHDDEVQIGTNTNTSSLTILRTQPSDTMIGLMTSLYSVRSSPSSQYIIQSTSTSTVFSLYSYSLHLDSQHPPSFTRTCTWKVNNQQQRPSMLTARLLKLLSTFLLTSSQLHTHSHKASS